MTDKPPQIVRGTMRIRVDEQELFEGVDFAFDRVHGTVILLRDCALGRAKSSHRLQNQVDFTKAIVKKKRKIAQWKQR